MSTKHKYPTVKQLEEGVVITCKTSGDEALEDLDATHVQLLLSEGFAEDDEDDEDEVAEGEFVAGLEVHLKVRGKKRWLFAGIFPYDLSTPWDEGSEDLLNNYIERLVEARGLEEEFDLEDDDDCPPSPSADSATHSGLRRVNGLEEFEAVVSKSKLPVLVDFTAQWCGPCQELAPHLARLAEEMEDKLFVAKIDIDKNEDLAGKLGIEAVPTLLMFKNGKKVGTMEGFETPADLKKFVKKHMGR